MVLVDTSVWIQHFRQRQVALAEMLNRASVLSHPFVVGELACGNLNNRAKILGHLAALPSATTASHVEVLDLIANRKLFGRGLGWIDNHLLASALISHCDLWTFDAALQEAAQGIGVRCFEPI